MTDDHDDLASAYLDGLLSAEDAARVEDDPRLLAEVDALAAVVERLQTEEAPVDPGTRQRHLSAAMAAFDQSVAPTNVIPLASAAGRSPAADDPTQVYPQPDDMARRMARVASATEKGGRPRRLETRRRQGLPSWLSAAAVLLVVGGGIGWFASRQSQDSDTASVSFDAATTAEGTGDGVDTDNDAALSQGAESAPVATAAASEAAKAGGSAAGSATADVQPAVPSPGATSTAPTAPPSTVTALPSTTTSRAVTSAAPSSTAPPSTTTLPGGLAFGSVPSGAEIQSRLSATGATPQPASGSSCGAAVAAPAGTTLTGYVPITVNGVAGEGLFYRSGSGSGATTVLVVRSSSCQAFS